jgi:hypothetical protein
MKADINVTPLIDVLLVLLIIFMVVAPVAPRALDASLPETREPPPGPTSPSLVLEVRADDFALNSTPVLTLHELDEGCEPRSRRAATRHSSSAPRPTSATRGCSQHSTWRRALVHRGSGSWRRASSADRRPPASSRRRAPVESTAPWRSDAIGGGVF